MLARLLLCFTTLLLANSSARADMAEWVPKATAEAAETALELGTEIRKFCQPCGDKAYRREVVADKYTQVTDQPDKYSLSVNGVVVDLAYVYFEKDGKWVNLGKAVGATVDGVPAELPADIQASLPDFDRMKYAGTIDGRLQVVLELSKYEREIYGNYYYTHVGHRLNLKGEFDPLGTFKLTESDDEEKKTGEFTGTLLHDGAEAAGTWTSLDGAKKLPFTLKRIALHGDENGNIVAGSQGTETHLDFPIFLPTFGPAYAAVNDTLQAAIRTAYTGYATQFASTAAELGIDPAQMMVEGDLGQSIDVGNHQIFLANEHCISVLFTISLYQGGAHGMVQSLAQNFRITATIDSFQVEPLSLANLLKAGPDVFPKLSERLVAGLKEKGASRIVDGDITAFKPEEIGAFTLSPKGLVFYFDPYAVASYAEGAFEVNVPFEDQPEVFNMDVITPLIAPAPVK